MATVTPTDVDPMSEEDVAQFRAMVRRVAAERISPFAADVDSKARFPQEAFDAMVESGLVGLPFAEDLGGQDAQFLAQVIAIEEIARVCATSALTLLISWVGSHAIVSNGSDELIREVIPGPASGAPGVSFCLTEPHAGSDLASLKTQARQDGGDWVINGRKCFISNAGWSDWYAVLAKTGENDYGVFAVHRDDPGISFGIPEKKMGLRGNPTADVVFENVRIPARRAVGDPTQGYRYMMAGLTYSRPIIGAQALGIAQGALDAAVDYVVDREAFGQSVSRFQMVRAMVADMSVKVESSRAMLYRTVEVVEAGRPEAREFASLAKLLCSDSAMAVTTDAVQLFGGYGFLQDYPVERMMRDAKITQIYEGTNQIQRLLVSRAVFDRRAAER